MVKIISDSTSDLTKELIDKLDISVIPLHILLGNDEYRDGIDITPDKIYKWADENKTTPKTSAVSIDDTIEMFKCVLEEDRDIVAFAISEDMSTTANVFRLAARELEAEDKIHVIDSENLSTGIGHLVVEAAVMAGKGMSAADIEKNILESGQALLSIRLLTFTEEEDAADWLPWLAVYLNFIQELKLIMER